MPKTKPYEAMSLEELEAAAADLFDQKVAIKREENVVQRYIDFHKATSGLPEDLRSRIKIDGGLAPKGGQA